MGRRHACCSPSRRSRHVGPVITPRKTQALMTSLCKRTGNSEALIDSTLMTNSCLITGPHLPRSLTIARFASSPGLTRSSWSKQDAGTDELRDLGWESCGLVNLLVVTPRSLLQAATWYWWQQVSIPRQKLKARTGHFVCLSAMTS